MGKRKTKDELILDLLVEVIEKDENAEPEDIAIEVANIALNRNYYNDNQVEALVAKVCRIVKEYKGLEVEPEEKKDRNLKKPIDALRELPEFSVSKKLYYDVVCEHFTSLSRDTGGLKSETLDSGTIISILQDLNMKANQQKFTICWGTNNHKEEVEEAIKSLSTYSDSLIDTLVECKAIFEKQGAYLRRKALKKYNLTIKENIFDDFYSRLPIKNDKNNLKEYLKAWFLTTIAVNYNTTDLADTYKSKDISYNRTLRMLELCLIIVGDKSMRKTTLIKNLCEGLNRIAKTTYTKGTYYTELPINFDDLKVDSLRALRNYGLIFNDELKTISTDKRDRNFKEFISKQTLSYRPLYSERLIDSGRRAGFITSTNDRALFYSDAASKRSVVLDFISPVDGDFLNMLNDTKIGNLYIGSLFGYFVDLYLREYKNRNNTIFDGKLQEELAEYNDIYMANSTMSSFVHDIIVRKEDLKNLIEDIDFYYIISKRKTTVTRELFETIQRLYPGQNPNYVMKAFEEVTSKEDNYSYLSHKVDGFYQIPVRMNEGHKQGENELETSVKGILGGRINVEVKTKDEFYSLVAKKLNQKVEEIKSIFKETKGFMEQLKACYSKSKGNYYRILCNIAL